MKTVCVQSAKCKWRMEMAPCFDLPIFPWNRSMQKNRPSYESPHPLQLKKLKPKTRKMKTMKTLPNVQSANDVVKSWNHSWNHSMTARHEIVKLQHGPSAVKSTNYSMGLLLWNRQIAAWAICREILKSQDGPPPMKLSNHSVGQLPWNCRTTAWAFCREIIKLQQGPSCVKSSNCREIVKLQQGPSGVKSSNCSMGHLPWNREITGWTASHEIVKSQHEPIAMKMSNCSMGICREIVKLQHGSSGVKSSNCSMVWIWKIFSVMCSW